MEAENFLDQKNPLEKFMDWHDEARRTSLKQPDAFTLSTLGKDGALNSRVLLVKEVRPNWPSGGLVFFTNYKSRKGQELEHSPRAAMTFYWDSLFRQVHFWGAVTKVSRSESEAYWKTRPRASQLSQWISKQSTPVSNREQMEQEWAAADKEFAGRDVPCPEHWGGYLLTPMKVEFWIGRDGRFHDRFTYQLVENRWVGKRLYP